MSTWRGEALLPPPPHPRIDDEQKALLLAMRLADLELVRYIDNRKRSMPPDLAAFATVIRDSRLQAVREIERRYRLVPYERS